MTDQILVSTDWLGAHLDDFNLRIVDIRGHVLPATEPPPHYFNHRSDYEASHIPGAVFVDWVYEITDPDDPRHAQIAKPERYAAVMRRLGIGSNTRVVAYDDAGGLFAARLWWSLKYYGHDQVVVLDGGWNKWTAEERPMTNAIPKIEPARFTPHANPALRRTSDDVLAALGSTTQLLDVRTRDEFTGKASRSKRKGHIPGAVNVPRQAMIAPDSTVLPREQLRQLFINAGIDESAPEIVTYCNGGVSASFGLMALHLAGFRSLANYDGSWKDWGNDDTKPIETDE